MLNQLNHGNAYCQGMQFCIYLSGKMEDEKEEKEHEEKFTTGEDVAFLKYY